MIIRNTDNDLKDAFLAKAKKLGLTVSNSNQTKNGIENIELGHCITVGTSDKFNVNWAKRIDYYADRQIVPVYDISLDWKAIVARLEAYAANVDNLDCCEEEEEIDENEINLHDGDLAVIHPDDNEVVFNGDLVLTKEDIKALKNLAAWGITVIVDSDDQTLQLGDISITEGELDEIAEKLDV